MCIYIYIYIYICICIRNTSCLFVNMAAEYLRALCGAPFQRYLSQHIVVQQMISIDNNSNNNDNNNDNDHNYQ